MSFTFYNPRKLDSDEVNPYATIMQKAIANHQAEEKLKKQRLENQYYGRGKESDMALQAAQAGLANANTGYVGEQTKWYGPKARSDISLQGAQAGHLGSMTQGQNISNRYAPTLNQQKIDAGNFKKENPFLNQPGEAGNLARLIYFRQHPELMGQLNQQQGGGQQVPGQNPQQMGQGQGMFPNQQQPQQTNPQQQPEQGGFDINKAIEASMNRLAHGKQEHQNLTPEGRFMKEYSDVMEGKVPGTNGTEHFKTEEEQKKWQDKYEEKGRQLAWKSSPANVKTYQIAQANGAGVNPDEASKWFADGKSLRDLYIKQGFDPENPPDADFPATQGNITNLNNRKAALKEMQVISSFVKKGLAPYSQTILDRSPAQIMDSLSGKNEQQQIDFFAAQALNPELINLRLNVANAKNTVHAIDTLKKKSLTNVEPFKNMVTPKMWLKIQDKIDNVLDEGLLKSAHSLTGQHKTKKISAALQKDKSDPLGIR